MHKGKTLEAYKVWRRIRGVESLESKEEFFVMKASVEEEEGEVASKATGKYPWMDFIRYEKRQMFSMDVLTRLAESLDVVVQSFTRTS